MEYSETDIKPKKKLLSEKSENKILALSISVNKNKFPEIVQPPKTFKRIYQKQ